MTMIPKLATHAAPLSVKGVLCVSGKANRVEVDSTVHLACVHEAKCIAHSAIVTAVVGV